MHDPSGTDTSTEYVVASTENTSSKVDEIASQTYQSNRTRDRWDDAAGSILSRGRYTCQLREQNPVDRSCRLRNVR